MRISIEAKELKTLLEKATPQIDKKSKVSVLQCVLLKAENNTLSATTTDLTTYLTVNTKQYNNIENGSILVHNDDIKLIGKLKGELDITKTSEVEAVIKAGKKSISIRLYDVDGFPTIPKNDSNRLFSIQEYQFTNAINKLINFVSNDESRPLMQCYHINVNKNRMDALDGHRIGMIDITPEYFADSKSILIHSNINKNLKKVLNNKSGGNLQFTENDDYISIIGKDFTYLQRVVKGEFYKVDQIVGFENDFTMEVNTKELKDIAKFNLDMVSKDDRKPMVFIYNNETKEHHIYFNSGNYKAIDKLDIIKADMMDSDFMIGFNPKFIYDPLNCIDSEQVTITGTKSNKAPITISAEGEKYLVLPVNIDASGLLEETIKEAIKNAA